MLRARKHTLKSWRDGGRVSKSLADTEPGTAGCRAGWRHLRGLPARPSSWTRDTARSVGCRGWRRRGSGRMMGGRVPWGRTFHRRSGTGGGVRRGKRTTRLVVTPPRATTVAGPPAHGKTMSSVAVVADGGLPNWNTVLALFPSVRLRDEPAHPFLLVCVPVHLLVKLEILRHLLQVALVDCVVVERTGEVVVFIREGLLRATTLGRLRALA